MGAAEDFGSRKFLEPIKIVLPLFEGELNKNLRGGNRNIFSLSTVSKRERSQAFNCHGREGEGEGEEGARVLGTTLFFEFLFEK